MSQPATRPLRRPMPPRRRLPLTPCHWDAGWWATVKPDRFTLSVAALAPGQTLSWPALPGVKAGDVFLLVSAAPDRCLRAWAWAAESPTAELDGSWSVTLRFGGHLADPVALRQLRATPGLTGWPALARVCAGRVEAIPPALWSRLTPFVRPAEPAPRPTSRPEPPTQPQTEPIRPAPACPWADLGRGPFFEALVRQVLLPQGYAVIELQAGRDASGIDLIAQRPQFRWTRLVAQMDATGEAVDETAVAEVVRGRQHHGAQTGLLIATGPVTATARAHASSAGIEIWDASYLHACWGAGAPGPFPDPATAPEASGPGPM
ncbi:MAG: restriction endonuclease [Candidatus Sericytochromatia bacterium]|nr:restriction endonuclease [Candidatus Sericytochromatia bacterium]